MAVGHVVSFSRKPYAADLCFDFQAEICAARFAQFFAACVSSAPAVDQKLSRAGTANSTPQVGKRAPAQLLNLYAKTPQRERSR